MKRKTLAGSAMAGGLLGLGMLAGSLVGTGYAFAQTPAAPNTAPVQQAAAAPAAQNAAAPYTAPAAQNAAAPVAQAATTPAPAAPSTPKATLTQAQAEAAALAASPGNTVDHTHLMTRNGIAVYDVDFTNGGGVIVDANTGAIVAKEAAGTDTGGGRGHGNKGANQAALAAKATVTQAQAEKTALAASPGATVDHSRLAGDPNGVVFWDVDFTNGGGVKVNAQTGAVIATEAAGTDHVGGGRPGGHGGRGDHGHAPSTGGATPATTP
jgi:uncharacterized membrane protein YkoI